MQKIIELFYVAKGRRPIISPARCTMYYRVGIVCSVINANGEFSRYQEEVRVALIGVPSVALFTPPSLPPSAKAPLLSSPVPILGGTPHHWPATTQDESLEMQRAVRSLGCACGR